MITDSEKMTLLSGMAMLVQSCQKESDLFDVASCYLPQLFQGRSGAIYLSETGEGPMEQRLAWGGAVLPKQMYSQCPVLRAGIPIEAAGRPDKACLSCGDGLYCVPFRDGPAAFGILCLNDDDPTGSERIRGLAFVTAEYLSMAASNIRLKDRLYEMAVKDPLTGLYNRRYMHEAFDKEIRRAERNRLPLGVIMVDIDYFKRINDTFGHAAGDRVLTSVARALISGLRQEDFVCRFGGEEFLFLLSGSALADSLRRAEEIREKIAGLDIRWEKKLIRPVTASLGVVAFPEHGKTFDVLVNQADQAMYKAKEGGRNRVE